MSATVRIETALEDAIARVDPGAPPRLARAIRHAVFPGGARVRPLLSLAVSEACGDDRPELSDAVAVAIELLHCASLVQDDLPCFDGADTRRGRPSVHAAFGEPLAVLVGDGLIVMAFECLARAGSGAPERLVPLIRTLSASAGASTGLVAGQAWESEVDPDLEAYHRAKTGSLFTAATLGGALAAGADPARWQALGDRLGEAYQVADDLRDAVSSPEELGKPARQDEALERPNAVATLGLMGALERLHMLLRQASDAVPDCPGARGLRELVQLQAKRLIPKKLAQSAA
jgi:geranylgeranyl diphosphate synthase, type II